MRKGTIILLIAIASAAGACDARPLAPEFTESTTTTSTLPGSDPTTTTTATLPPPEERVVGTVSNVTDGDTVDVLIEGVETTVRLLGINAPEMAECWGPESAAALTGLVLGQEVLVVAGEEDLDGFGRALRFLYLENGGAVQLVNSDLVATGNAVAIQNGNEFASAMKASEARAFQSGKGMWGTFACGDSEGVQADRPVIRVSELNPDPIGPDDDALDQEYITIVNEGYDVVSIDGWTMRDESSTNRMTFPPGTTLDVGDSATVVTGCEGGPVDAIHWCSDTPIWSNGGDTAIVADTLGNVVIWYTYAGEAG